MNIINEILKVIVWSTEFDEKQYGDFGAEIKAQVTNWVKDYDVKNVEFTVANNLIKDVYKVDANEDKENITSLKVNVLEDSFYLNKQVDKVLEHYSGPGFDSDCREDTKWNANYFYTGSDCTHYVLVKKIA